MPEPWASRLVLEGGGSVLVDEKSLWPGGRFVTTQLVVRTQFLEEHPQTVKALLEGQVAADEAIAADPAGGQDARQRRAGAADRQGARAGHDRPRLQRTSRSPRTRSPRRSGPAPSTAFATGLTQEADLTGIYDLRLLREVLGTDVPDAGLGAPTTTPATTSEKKG